MPDEIQPQPPASGAAAAPAAPPAQAQAPAPTPTARVELTPDEYRSFLDARSRLAEIEAEKARELEAKEQEKLRAMAEKGQAEEALNRLRQAKDAEIDVHRKRAADLEGEILGGHCKAIRDAALMGYIFLSDEAAALAREHFEGRLEAVRDQATGTVRVIEKGTGKPADEAIKAWMSDPARGFLLASTTAGGAGAAGTHKSGEPEKPDPAARLVEQLRASIARQSAGAVGLRGEFAQKN